MHYKKCTLGGVMKVLVLTLFLMFVANTSYAFDTDMGKKDSVDMNTEIDQAFAEEESMADSISELTTDASSETLEALEELDESYVGASNQRLPISDKKIRQPNSIFDPVEIKI